MSIDAIDRKILAALAGDGRMSIKELAARIGLSAPSTSERLRRLEDDGVVQRFTLELNPKALGYQLQAIIRIKPLPGRLASVEKALLEMDEIIECDKVTGDDCFVVRVHLRSIEDLDRLVDRLAQQAEINTSLVKAVTVPRRLPPLD